MAIMNRRSMGGILVVLILSGSLGSAAAADWPQYRGPQRDGVSLEKGWLATWPEDGLEVLWKREVGEGYSTVAVARGRVYTMGLVGSAKDLREKIWCFDAATGDVVWEHSYPAKATPYRGTRCTPTVDGSAVFTYGVNGQLCCLDAESGKIVWQKDVQQDLGAKMPTYGYGASPIIVQGLIVVPVRIVTKDPKALLMAFDKATGQEKWRYFHESEDLGGGYWSNAVPAVLDGRPSLVYATGEGCLGLDPLTGVLQWHYQVSEADFKKAGKWRGCIAQEPAIEGNRVFVCAHFRYGEGYTIAIEVAGKQAREIWRSEKLGNWGTCNVVMTGHLYGIHHPDVGAANPLCCFRTDTGALQWTHKGVGRTLTAIDGKLLSFDGTRLYLGQISPSGYEKLAQSQMLFGEVRSKNPATDQIVPVLSNGRIYCRNMAGQLVCLNVQSKSNNKGQ